MSVQKAFKSDNESYYKSLYSKHVMLEDEFEKNVEDYNVLNVRYTANKEEFEKNQVQYNALVGRHEALEAKAATDLENIKGKFTIYMRHTKYIQKQNSDDLAKEKTEYSHLYSGYLGLMKKNGETKDAYNSLQIANEALQEEYNSLEIEFNTLARRFAALEAEEEELEKEEEALEDEEEGEEDALKEQIELLTEKYESLLDDCQCEEEEAKIKYTHLSDRHERLSKKHVKDMLAKKDIVTVLKIELKKLKEQHKKDLGLAGGAMDGLGESFEDLQRRHAAHQRKHNDLEGVHATLEDQIKAAKKRYNELFEKYQDLNADYTAKFGDHEMRYEELKRKHQADKDRFNANYRQFKENYTRLQAEYIQTVDENEKKYQSLHDTFVTLQERNKSVQNEYDMLNERYMTALKQRDRSDRPKMSFGMKMMGAGDITGAQPQNQLSKKLMGMKLRHQANYATYQSNIRSFQA